MSPLQSQQQERDFFTVSHQHTSLYSSLPFQAGWTWSERTNTDGCSSQPLCVNADGGVKIESTHYSST